MVIALALAFSLSAIVTVYMIFRIGDTRVPPVVGKTEVQRVFELLGRKGEVGSERLALRDTFEEALAAYRQKNWEAARTGFEDCLTIIPGDGPSKVFLGRITQFCTTAPSPDWNCVWSLVEK